MQFLNTDACLEVYLQMSVEPTIMKKLIWQQINIALAVTAKKNAKSRFEQKACYADLKQ